IGGVQKPVFASPRAGHSFSIGLLSAQDRKLVPLAKAHPLIVRANFQAEEELDDVLDLGGRIDERLRVLSERGGAGAPVFIDAGKFPDAYRLVGRYTIKGTKVSVKAGLFLGGKKAASVTASGEKNRPDDLAARLAEATRKELAKLEE